MSKSNNNNILANCFKKPTKNIKDYIPSNIRPENIREDIPLKFPENVDHIYEPDLFPNILFEEWPSDEQIKEFDFSNSGQKFNDPQENLIIFPNSLRKETYNSMKWMRPDEYVPQKVLLNKIKEKYNTRNYNYIKNKFDIAQSNFLNYEHEKVDSEENENSENENKLPEISPQKKELGSVDDLKITIKRRNSIDIAKLESENYPLVKEFYSSKLNAEEKKLYIENKEEIFNYYIVNFDNTEPEKIEEPQKQIPNNAKKNVPIENIEKHYTKLLPSNLNLSIGLCDYCRWVSSQFQILLDNDIEIDNISHFFIRNIYPQDEKGVPKYNPSGLYWVKLYHMGKFRKIIIDDKFPVNKETYDNFFPQCVSPFELWPMLLTKALIKLYSYKYRCDSYEQDEVGDCSILYSLTKFIGVKLPSIKLMDYLNTLQEIKNKQLSDEINEKEENRVDIMPLSNNKENKNKVGYGYGYDLLIGYINSKNYIEENSSKTIDQQKNYSGEENKFPKIESCVKYSEKTIKIKDINPNLRNRRNRLNKKNMNVPPEYQLLYEKMNKYSGVSTQKELDPHKRFENYFYEHRFLTNENIYNSYQKYHTEKTNKIFKNGIICDVGYSLLELFQCGHFNMKRLKPIYFGDMKLDIKVKYKQMSPDEKAIYLEQIKDLRIRQKKEKTNRINEYLSLGNNLLCLKFTNESLCKDNKKAYEIETLFSLKEIEAAKFCIKNYLAFPPEQYFESSFIPKTTKDEETGEINFWTKKFYHKLLRSYFKSKENELKLLNEEKIKKLQEEKNEKNEKNMEMEVGENENQEEEQEPVIPNLFKEFEDLCQKYSEELNALTQGVIPGTWMTYEDFKQCFNNFILFKNMNSFSSQLIIDNVWYNYDKDIYEEKCNTNLIHLIKNESHTEEEKKETANKNEGENENEYKYNNILEEDELYIIFEPNSEKNKKSVSSQLPYTQNEETGKGNKFDDITFSLTLAIYAIDSNKKITKISSKIVKNYFNILNLNLSKLTNENDIKEYFISIQGGLCPFGYNLILLSNIYNIENYSYGQFLCSFKGFTEKKINIMHPILPNEHYYLMMHFTIEHKKADEESENKLVKFYTIFNGYDDNVLKSNIEVVLINSITNKKVRIYFNKIFEINFTNCPKYVVELSIIPPGNIPERNFEYCILFDNPNINIETYENMQPFYIRQKYIPNKHNIVFNELLFPSDSVIATLDISLEYRPNEDENNIENNNNNFTDESLPQEKHFPNNIRMLFYFSQGEELVFKKDFENQTLIRNLLLTGKIINPKEVDNKRIYETYSIKCCLDPDSCPSWLLKANEYKGDVYWRIGVFITDPLAFIKNTLKEDKEKAVKESWEINEPGRKEKAEKSRKKYFVNIKYNNGEMLSPDEEELIPELAHRKETIECNSDTLVTNIPPKAGNLLKKNLSQTQQNNENNKEEVDIMKKLPKIKNYCSLVMKNFYSYSNQNRVITKNSAGSLPKINNQFCKTQEQREQEVKELEEKVNQYYEDMKKKEEEEKLKQENYFNQIQEMNDKFYEERQKMNSNKENENLLDEVIQKNNSSLAKGREIKDLFDTINQDMNINEELTDDILFDWYENLKLFIEMLEKKECTLSNQYLNMIENIKKKLAEIFVQKVDIILKPEKKTKPEIIKKYKNIKDENILVFDERKETKAILEKLV